MSGCPLKKIWQITLHHIYQYNINMKVVLKRIISNTEWDMCTSVKQVHTCYKMKHIIDLGRNFWIGSSLGPPPPSYSSN